MGKFPWNNNNNNNPLCLLFRNLKSWPLKMSVIAVRVPPDAARLANCLQLSLNCRIFRLVIAKRSLSVNAVAISNTTKLREYFQEFLPGSIKRYEFSSLSRDANIATDSSILSKNLLSLMASNVDRFVPSTVSNFQDRIFDRSNMESWFEILSDMGEEILCRTGLH